MQETQEEVGMELRDRGNQEVGQCGEAFCSHCHHCQDLLYKEQEEDPDYGDEDDPDYSGGEDQEEEVDDSKGDSESNVVEGETTDEEEDEVDEVDVPKTRGRGRPLKPFAELKPLARCKVTEEIKKKIEKLVEEREDVRYQSSGISIA